MKKSILKLNFILPFIFALIPVFMLAQSAEKGKIGLNYSLNGGTSVLQPALEGSASHTITHASAFGLTYLKPINNWLEWETGLTYTLFKITTTSAPLPEVTTRHSSMSLLDIPVGVRAGFWKYFFANGGLLLDLDMMSDSPVSSQSGIGGMLGAGVKYDFNFGGSLFVNPYIKMHSILPFSLNSSHDRILESGIKFGVMYRL